MKSISKVIAKTALVAVVVSGFGAGSVSAAQAIHPDYAAMNPQQAKRAASQLRELVSHSPVGDLGALHPHVTHVEALGVRELFKAKATGNLDAYVTEAKNAVKAATNHYFDTVLMGAGNNAVIIGTVANGGPGQPADLLRDSFKAALNAAIDAPNTAALTLLDGRVALPATLKLQNLVRVEEGVKTALGLAVEAWIDTLLAPNAAFLDNAVARQDNGGGPNTPANVQRDSFKAALTAVIDEVSF